LTRLLVRVNLPFVDAYESREAPSADLPWEALGDRTRRAILQCLADRPLAVGELAARLPVSRPAVSQHLRVLKESGLVSDESVGTRNIYRLNPTGISALRDQLDTFWNRTLAGFEAAIDESPEAP